MLNSLKLPSSFKFGTLFFNVYGTLLFIGSLTLLIAGSYLGLRPIEMLSFRSNDGYCDQVTNGIGNHCFGDYQTPMVDDYRENPWVFGNAFTPSAMSVHAIFAWLKTSFLGPQGSLFLYLFLLIIALSFPIYKSLVKLP
ncbi:MAG: hypothetical protein RL228_745, partial [Actinomycetota bacterium]